MSAMERLHQLNPKALTIDGHDNAFVGICYRFGMKPLAIYDREIIIRNIMSRTKGMSRGEIADARESAEEFLVFNIEGAWAGNGTPMFVDKVKDMNL